MRERSFAALRISPAGSDARKTAQVQIHSPRPLKSCNKNTIGKTERGRGPSLRSGFRLRARTPARRLKFKSTRPDHLNPATRTRLGKLSEGEVLRCAQDFACGLGRPQDGSSSNPFAPTTFTPRDRRQSS